MGTQSAQRSQAMYREEEKLCLKWNDFQENAISAFGTLREDREFADVTLACEDGQQVEAHKVILASSSPFFLNLLKRNKHPHPLIYMRGLKSEDLVAMIDFLYFGEAKVNQENLDSFLAVAEEFQLKGLMGSGAKKEAKEIIDHISLKSREPEVTYPTTAIQRVFTKNETNSDDFSYVGENETTTSLDDGVDFNNQSVIAELENLDAQIKSMMEVSAKGRICKVCGKEGPGTNIMNHIESKHITGVSHTCNICGTTARSRPALSMHKRRNHKTN